MRKLLISTTILILLPNLLALNGFGFFQSRVQTESENKPKVAPYAEQVLRFQVLSSALNSNSAYFDISKELDLTEFQTRELSQKLSHYFIASQGAQIKLNSAAIQAKSENRPSMLDDEKKAYEKLMIGLVEETEKSLTEILLPHQVTRLGQVSFQMQMARNHNAKGAFVLLPIVESLDTVSDREKASFREKVKKLEKEYKDDLVSLRKKYESALWEEVSPEVRKQLEEKMGDLVYEDR
jgi:hypothetical protein